MRRLNHRAKLEALTQHSRFEAIVNQACSLALVALPCLDEHDIIAFDNALYKVTGTQLVPITDRNEMRRL